MLRLKENIDFCSWDYSLEGYGGYLKPYGYGVSTSREDFNRFLEVIHFAIENRQFMPIYRMADGEFQFLFGKRPKSDGGLKDFIGTILRRLNLLEFKTSWGEKYSAKEKRILKARLNQQLLKIAEVGRIAVYWNENGLNAHTEFNEFIEHSFHSIGLNNFQNVYVPFHFPVGALIRDEKLFYNKRILLISSCDSSDEKRIKQNLLQRRKVKDVSFIRISPNRALFEVLDLSQTKAVDLVLIAAGIGSVNILSQLTTLNVPCIDIGGFVQCLKDKDTTQHGGMFKFT